MAKQLKSDGEESTRMWASASFVGVLIIIGVPLWWKTTEVYRVSLPYDKIASFDDQPHFFTTALTVMANDHATASEIAGLIEKAFEDSVTLKLNVTIRVLPDHLRGALESFADEPEAVEEVAASVDVSRPNTLHVVQRTPLYQHVWVAGERVVFFRDSKAGPTLIKALQHWIYQTRLLSGAGAAAARRARVPPSDGYHVVLSVAAPDARELRFDARQAMEDYIGTFVDELSELHNFTLKSQWLYMLDFDFQAREVKDSSAEGRHFAVRQDRLHLLLTRLEERAATHVSPLPTINLALYAVPCAIAPLLIYDNDDNRIPAPVQAFMSPQWGGAVLASPPAPCAPSAPSAPFAPSAPRVMGAFVAQLRLLLGIPDTMHIEGASLDPLRSVTPRRWEVDALLRLRTLELIASAENTLKSLAQLLGEISNIAINDEVGASVEAAAAGARLAATHARAGRAARAHAAARAAHRAAEAAFTAPTLLALLYFPDDQKYAIYIPLFLPIMFPVILSLKNLLLWMRGKPLHKEKTD